MRTGTGVMGGVVVWAALAGGCSTTPPQQPPPGRVLGGGNPFYPQMMRVHPLSHISAAPDGKPEVVCHIDFRDRWGDSTKAVGPLTVRLFGPDDSKVGGPERELVRWDVNLSDEDLNAALFDPATRTYRLQLAGGPEWLMELREKGEGGAAAKLTLQAVLGPAAGGSAVVLNDQRPLRK